MISIGILSIVVYNITLNYDKSKNYPYSCNVIYIKEKEDVFKRSSILQKKKENDKIIKQENEIKRSDLLNNLYDKKPETFDMGIYSSIKRVSQSNDNYDFSSDNFV